MAVTGDAAECGHRAAFYYGPTTAGGTQIFTIFFDSAAVTGISALIMAGVSSMFF